ncbi:MAG: DUF2490 domain-containing protein [Tannerellaceae bacterium]|jgi:hypothetical protein|nr:DUF2490 domain-containing protein [Tannerellaceae bacterium]
MKIKSYILTVIFLSVCIPALSQTSDWGIWTNIGADISLTNKWRLGAEVEYRRKNNMRQTDQLVGGVDASYSLNRYMKIGVGYERIAEKDIPGNIFNHYNRYMFNLPFSYKYRRFSLGWRPRLQVDVEENYPANSDWVMRNRFSVKYEIPTLPLNPYMRIELFNRVFTERIPSHYKDRIAAGMEYRIRQRHSVYLGYMVEPKYAISGTRKANIIQTSCRFLF